MNNKLDFDSLFRSINIIAVISNKINLKKKGSNYWAVCPFHKDTTPSLSVNDQKQIFKCFSCGAAGNAVTFLQRYENINFMQALKEALILSNADENIINSLQTNFKLSNNEKIYLINKYAMNLMNNYLLIGMHKSQIKNFLDKRNINLEIISKFNLGYIDETYYENFYNSLFQFIKENFDDEIPDDILRKTNLFHYNETDKNNKLFFNYRIMFPILDKLTNIVGFSGRDITDKSKAKYLNSIESNFFIKGNYLYNYYSLNTINVTNYVIIVEGYMDCISLVNHNYLSTVATMGTSLTKNQLKLLFDIKNNTKIILSFDNDKAGQNAFLKNLSNILDYESNLNTFIPVYISGLHESNFKDTDELFNNLEENKAKNIFDNNQNALYIAAKFILENDNNIEFNINESFKYILQYSSYNFGIYVDNALNLYKNYLINNKNISLEQIDNIINKLSDTKKIIKKNVNNSKNEISYQKKYRLAKLNRYFNLLNINQTQLIFIFLYYPFESAMFVQEYKEEIRTQNILNNDKVFSELNNKLIKSNLLKSIDINSKEYSYYTNFSYLLFIYIEYFDLNKFEDKNIQNNFNYLVNESDFFNNLKDDEIFYEGKGIYNYLKKSFGHDYENNNFNNLKNMNQIEINKLLNSIFKKIIEILMNILLILKKQ